MRDPSSLTPDQTTRIILDWHAAHHAGPSVAGGKELATRAAGASGRCRAAGLCVQCRRVCRSPRWRSVTPASLVNALSDGLAHRGWADRPARGTLIGFDGRLSSRVFRRHLSVLPQRARPRRARARSSDVFDSLWEPAAVAYRQRLELGEQDAAMAVVVMPLVPAVASGIAFYLRSGIRVARTTWSSTPTGG